MCMTESLPCSSESITTLLTGYVCAKSLQLCPTLCNPMDYSLPGSSVHGILQARILEWVAMHSSRGSSQTRDGTPVSYVAGRFLLLSHLGSPMMRLAPSIVFFSPLELV